MVTYLLNNDKFTQNDALIWEKEFFEDTINQYNQGTLDYKKYLPNEEILIKDIPVKLKLTYLSERSIPDEL